MRSTWPRQSRRGGGGSLAAAPRKHRAEQRGAVAARLLRVASLSGRTREVVARHAGDHLAAVPIRVGVHNGEQAFAKEEDDFAVQRASVELGAFDKGGMHVLRQADGEWNAVGHEHQYSVTMTPCQARRLTRGP